MVRIKEIFEADIIDFVKRKKRFGMSDQEKYDRALKTQKGEPEYSKYTWDPLDPDNFTFIDSSEQFADLVLKVENELPNFEGQMKDGATRYRVLPIGDDEFIVKDSFKEKYLEEFSRFNEALLFAYVNEVGLEDQYHDLADILLV